MTRPFKKNAYGLLFLIVLFFFFYVLYSVIFGFDKGPGNGEEVIGAFPLEIIKDPLVLEMGDNLFAISRVFNPNLEFRVRDFRYNFHLYDRFGREMEKAAGRSFIDNYERKYVYSLLGSAKENIVEIKADIGAVDWVRVGDEWHGFEIAEVEVEKIEEGIYSAEGKFINREAVPLTHVKLGVVFVDFWGNPMGVSEGSFFDVAGFEERSFRIVSPPFRTGSFGLNLRATNVFVKELDW